MSGHKCLICGHNNPSDARFCQQCGNPLEITCPNCQTDNAVTSKFCKNCGYALAEGVKTQPGVKKAQKQDPAMDPRYMRLAASTPAALAEKMKKASPSLAGERRIVTALFADVVGSTSLAEQMDPEDWTAIMNRAFDLLTPVIYRYEGSIARLMGDALLAFFGAPIAHDDDPVRAVRAALDLLSKAREYATELSQTNGIEFGLRVGLNTGQVVVGEVGSNLAYEYTAMGDAVNLAARLQSAAAPMTVLIGESTYHFVRPVFDCIDRGKLSVKGKAEPVRVYEVKGIKSGTEGLRERTGLESPLVGRDNELNRLLQISQATQAGLGRAALVLGEPGIGKSRLLAEWKSRSQILLSIEAQANGLLWVTARCLSYGQGLPYHLIIDMLRSLLELSDMAGEMETAAALSRLCQEYLGNRSAEVRLFLGHLLSLHLEQDELDKIQRLDPHAIRSRYLSSLRMLIKAITRRRPLVLVLDDIQQADPSSIDFLIKLLPLISEAPLLLCCAARVEQAVPGWKLVAALRDSMGSGLTEIQLGVLSEDDSSRLVSQMLRGDDLPENIHKIVFEKGEGNPLFMEEVVRMLLDRKILLENQGNKTARDDFEALDIPDNLQGLLLARIDRLPEEVKHTLRVASVIGRQFSLNVLREVLASQEPD